ncbi:MAG: beta-lactamase family protein [Bacteroidales bacterium]|nr:beta-lactamase family protein [Bacteroidales bacterium]MBN2755964.1 beta-lactamase family protein [Bacteroidales bacterium]
MSLKKILIFFLSIILISSCGNSKRKNKKALAIFSTNKLVTEYNDLSLKIDNWFKNLYSTSRFSGNILVAINDTIIYENTSGYSNYETKDTLTTLNSFQLASVSKQFTSMAIMILKERNKISYNDDIQKFIPDFPYKGITIKQLLTHRSGLPNYNYFSDQYTDKETTIYNKDVIKLMIDSIPAAYYPPNTRFDYCNTNYVILASIVEKASKMPFEKFLKYEIFKKAEMNNTSIFIKNKNDRIYNATKGYHYKWLEAEPSYQDGVIGDKGIYSTVEDLLKWNIALNNNKLVRENTLNEAFNPAQPEKKGNKNYGFGWRILKCIDNSSLIYHGGWWRGYNSLYIRDKKNNATIIILSNIRTRSFYNSFRELLGIIDTSRLQQLLDFEEKLASLKEEKPDSLETGL